MKLGLRLAILVSLFSLSATAACGSGGEPASPEPASPEALSPQPPSTNELAQAVVQIQALDAARSAVWWGSGTVITSDGLILTNAHVVDNRLDEYDVLGVAMTDLADEPPELSYLAEITAVDYTLDLAVIRIVSDLDGNRVEIDLPFVTAGDSDEVGLGDHINILGFPGIGGETITFTDGVISGFTGERGIANRAWIKTDATTAGGNSGGLAANDAGELVGVPTIGGAGAEVEEFVDCRYVADTNRDGAIDDLDNCVPVGGFINGLRPVNLALPMIQAATAGVAYVSRFPQVEPPTDGAFDTSGVIFSNLIFSVGVAADDQPATVVDFFFSGVTEACAFWDYEGMADGLSWEALWFIDGELDEAASFIDETWVGGESGNWWVCIVDERGLPDGLYEIVISVEGEAQAGDAVFVGGDHPLVELSLENLLTEPICYAFISPTGAQNWGMDKLGPDEGIPPADTGTFFVPASTYDLLLENCDQEILVEEYEMDVSEAATYEITE